MKLILKFINEQKIKLILVGLIILLYLPSLFLHFSLIDDGLTLHKCNQIKSAVSAFNFQGLASTLVEPEYGRVRPAYWIWQTGMCIVSGENAPMFHLLRIFILIATIFFIEEILKKLDVHELIRIVGLLFYAFSFENFENYYRLGPVEPFIAFSMAVIFWILITQRYLKNFFFYMTLFLLFLCSFTKETFGISVVSLLSYTIVSYLNNKKTFSFRLIIISLTPLLWFPFILFILKTYGSSPTYASNYAVNLTNFSVNIDNIIRQFFFHQFPFLQIVAVVVIAELIDIWRNKKFSVKSLSPIALFAVFSLVQLAALLPWRPLLPRYFILANLGLTVIYSLSLNSLANRFSNFKMINVYQYKKYLVFLVAGFCFIALLIHDVVFNANYQTYARLDSDMSYSIVKSLATKIPKNSTVLVNYKNNLNNYEIYTATPIHLNELYNRKDINFPFLSAQNLCAIAPRYILDRDGSDRLFSSQTFLNSNLVKFSSKDFKYEILDELSVWINFRNAEKSIDWSHNLDSKWILYIQKSESCIKASRQTQI